MLELTTDTTLKVEISEAIERAQERCEILGGNPKKLENLLRDHDRDRELVRKLDALYR